jgi:hypothetical protein
MKLRTLAGLFSLRWRKPVACERCSQMFTCGATLTGCWCTEIKLGAATRAEMRMQYKHCLCRACLESFAEKEQSSQKSSLEVKT